jgi:hypothetical protein
VPFGALGMRTRLFRFHEEKELAPGQRGKGGENRMDPGVPGLWS